jgi:hypothetical protein
MKNNSVHQLQLVITFIGQRLVPYRKGIFDSRHFNDLMYSQTLFLFVSDSLSSINKNNF